MSGGGRTGDAGQIPVAAIGGGGDRRSDRTELRGVVDDDAVVGDIQRAGGIDGERRDGAGVQRRSAGGGLVVVSDGDGAARTDRQSALRTWLVARVAPLVTTSVPVPSIVLTLLEPAENVLGPVEFSDAMV